MNLRVTHASQKNQGLFPSAYYPVYPRNGNKVCSLWGTNFLSFSRRLPTAAAWVRAQAESCGICGQSGTLSEQYGLPCQFSFHRLLHNHHHLLSGSGTMGQIVPDVPSGLSLTPPQEIKKILFYVSPFRSNSGFKELSNIIQYVYILYM
jgi:hypothetical protein